MSWTWATTLDPISSTESSNPVLDTTTSQFLSDKSENSTLDSPIMIEECGKQKAFLDSFNYVYQKDIKNFSF